MTKYSKNIPQGYGLTSPLQDVFPSPIRAQRAPVVGDVGNYPIGQIWINENTASATFNHTWILTSVAAGAAHWSELGNALTDFDTLTGDAGTTPVVPDAAHNIDILGGDQGPIFTGGTNTLTLSMPTLEFGDSTTRFSDFIATDANVLQVYADDDTASGAADRSAIEGNLLVTAGDGNHTPQGVTGYISTDTGSDMLSALGVYGYCLQANGSVIQSTAAGVEGHLDLVETTNADLPAVYAFAVKGYLDATDTTGIPAGIVAGIGSVVEYNTPFNAKAYGVAVSRLDAGAGAGTAGQAAYGVVQGTVAIADWLYGVDLYNGAAGVAYTNADIRLWDQSTLASDDAAVTLSCVAGDDFDVELGDDIGANVFSVSNNSGDTKATVNSYGDIEARSIVNTNLNIPSFYASPLMTTAANTGGVATGNNGDVNLMCLQGGEIMEQFMIGAQTIIAPRLTSVGLEIGLDKTNSEGVEYNWGTDFVSRFVYTIGTSQPFYMKATVKVTDTGTCDPLWFGFRVRAANNAVFTNYTDAAVMGLRATTNADTVITGSNLNGAGWSYTNSTDAFTDGQTKTLEISVNDAGIVSFQLDGNPLTASESITFDNSDQIIPFIHLVHSAGGTPNLIELKMLEVGYSVGYIA